MTEFEPIESSCSKIFNEGTEFLKSILSELGLSNSSDIFIYILTDDKNKGKFYEFISKNLNKAIQDGKLTYWKNLHGEDILKDLNGAVDLFFRDYVYATREMQVPIGFEAAAGCSDEKHKLIFENSTIDFHEDYGICYHDKTIFAYDENRRFL